MSKYHKLPPWKADEFLNQHGVKPVWRGGRMICDCPNCKLPVELSMRTTNPEDKSQGHGKKAPTLADAVLRESFDTRYWDTVDPDRFLPDMISKARKFVLNEEMSAFMVDLANAAVLAAAPGPRRIEIVEGMRKLTRAPHALTWIEFNNHAKMRRSFEEYHVTYEDGSGPDYEHAPTKVGWLIKQHDTVETAFWALPFCSHVVANDGSTKPHALPQPVAHVWCTENHPFPFDILELAPYLRRTNQEEWPPGGPLGEISASGGGTTHVSTLSVGVTGYQSPYVGLLRGPQRGLLIEQLFETQPYSPVNELKGDLRYLWALLATINDLPTTVSTVVSSKGYVAKGRYRKFVDHSVIRLNVPNKQYRQVAKKAVMAAKRRAHQVRGHWRKNWRKPGERFWIKEHERGDASLGYVLHDYAVTHDTDKDESHAGS